MHTWHTIKSYVCWEEESAKGEKPIRSNRAANSKTDVQTGQNYQNQINNSIDSSSTRCTISVSQFIFHMFAYLSFEHYVQYIFFFCIVVIVVSLLFGWGWAVLLWIFFIASGTHTRAPPNQTMWCAFLASIFIFPQNAAHFFFPFSWLSSTRSCCRCHLWLSNLIEV